MNISLEDIKDHIPYYLTVPQKEGLIKALSDFPDSFPYYCSGFESNLLQGDGWKGFQIYDFSSGNKAEVKGIVLSNSCDVSLENARDLPVKVTFAPIIRISDYRHALEKAGVSSGAIDTKLNAIRSQRVTELFYLPPKYGVSDGYIVLFSDLHSMPLPEFINVERREKEFTLSLCGFYLFLLKLSIHFCRFHEGVSRGI